MLEGRFARVNMKEYKNQHYVPQTLLKGFTNNDIDLHKSAVLWKFDKDSKEIRLKGIEHICNEDYYYSFKDTNNEYNHGIEKMFSRFENDFNKIKYRANCIRNSFLHQKKVEWFTRSEIKYIAQFMIFQIYRVPKIIDNFFNKMTIGFSEMNKKEGIVQTDNELINDIKKIGLRLMFDLKDHNYIMLQDMLLAKNMIVTVTPYQAEEGFIITDNPVLITNKEEKNAIINNKTEITMAITKNIALSFFEYGTDKSCGIIRDADIDTINISLMKNAARYCFSGKKKTLEKLLLTIASTA